MEAIDECEVEEDIDPWLLSPKLACKTLGVSRPTLLKLVRDGVLPFVTTPGGHRRYLSLDVERILNERREC
jgi:excisionase family DNA binding protein